MTFPDQTSLKLGLKALNFNAKDKLRCNKWEDCSYTQSQIPDGLIYVLILHIYYLYQTSNVSEVVKNR